MRTLDRSLAALLLVTGFVAPAQAESGSALRVEGSVSSAECPDAAALGERVAGLRGRAGGAGDSAYLVEFSRTSDGFSAIIRGADGTARVIEAQGPSCAPLAQATAVTLALLLDSEQEPEAVKAKPRPPDTRPPRAPVQALAREDAAGSRSSRNVFFLLGAGALGGVLRPVAPAFSLEAGFELGPFRTGLGGLWAIPQTLELGPGSVRKSLFSGSVRECFAITRARAARFEACSGLFIGAERAEAAGYTTNVRRTRSWLAIPAEISFGQRTRGVGWEIGAALLLPLVHNEFVIEGQGAAYSPPPVSALVSLRALGLFPW